MDGVIEIKPGKEYLVKLKMQDVKFYAPDVPNTNAAKNDTKLNLIPLPELIRMSGKKNGINCSFFDYSYPWWVGPYADDRHYDPVYKDKKRKGLTSTLYITKNNVLKVSTNVFSTLPTDVKYIVSVVPIAVEDGVKKTSLQNGAKRRRSMIGSLNDGSFFVYIFNYEGKRSGLGFQDATNIAFNYLGNIQNAAFIDGGTSTSLIINHQIVVKTGYPGFPNAIVW